MLLLFNERNEKQKYKAVMFIRVCFPGHLLGWRDTCNLFPIPSTVHVIAVAVMNFFTCIEVWIKWYTLVFFNRTIYHRYRCSSYEIWTIYSKKYLLCVLLFSCISSLSHWRCGGDFKCTTHSLKCAVLLISYDSSPRDSYCWSYMLWV